MSVFNLSSEFKPSGDQPQAIDKLANGIFENKDHQILLGVTGSGKTYTIANVIEKVNRPTLVIAHNKTLAAQLCAEFREFFPDNAVEYFVSYYDYYQPEAYIPSRDAYIEKEAQINEEIERLRHSATRSLLMRRDVIVVASVSCIYGLGLPEEYIKGVIFIKVGDEINRQKFLLSLEKVQYERNDMELIRGRYRVKGEVIDIFPSYEDHLIRVEFFGDEVDRILVIHPVSGEVIDSKTEIDIYPATHYVVHDSLERALKDIDRELVQRVKYFESEQKLVEAMRIEQRTKYDMEMLQEVGYCKGIENYARVISNRPPGEPPGVLLDFFPDDFLTVIDESHVTIPQIGGMYNGDQARKQNLVDYGFRLPSAKDNRPLKFTEFESKVNNCIYVSATPGNYELDLCKTKHSSRQDLWKGYDIVEQVIRPTGLIDPEIDIFPTKDQIKHLIGQIQPILDRKERVLVTTLTKKMSEDLSAYLDEHNFNVCYLHSDIKALDRIDILHDLRAGKYDILVGVNLLREGLDLPEVSLVAIMDADKEGFLRNERSLIQTMGRAARNVNGKVILYADSVTGSMQRAIDETNRRRSIQIAYNEKHGIKPKTISKKLKDIRSEDRELIAKVEKEKNTMSKKKKSSVIEKLKKDMEKAAKELQFELAAVLRDQIKELENIE